MTDQELGAFRTIRFPAHEVENIFHFVRKTLLIAAPVPPQRWQKRRK